MKVKNVAKQKMLKRELRHRRVRAKITGTGERPRFSVFRSAKHLSAQLIDDYVARTLASASDTEVAKVGPGKVAVAEAVGRLIAERAKAKGISMVVFDRGGYAYHGRVKALADGARAGGLQF